MKQHASNGNILTIPIQPRFEENNYGRGKSGKVFWPIKFQFKAVCCFFFFLISQSRLILDEMVFYTFLLHRPSGPIQCVF